MHIRRAASLPFASLLLFLPLRAQAPERLVGAPEGLPAIVGKELLAHATFLASDELEGRLTGSRGQERAAEYIASVFAQLDLEPLGDEVDGKRTFVQRYGITRVFVTEDSWLKLGDLQVKDGFAVLGGKPMATKFEGKLRYCGLGRTRGVGAEVGEDDRLEGQIPVVLVKTPRGKVKGQLSVEAKFGASFQTFSALGRTAKNLEKKGAAAVLFLMVADPTGLIDVLNYLALAPGKDLLSPRFPGADNQMGMVASMLGDSGTVASLVLGPQLTAKVLVQLGLDVDAVRQYLAGEAEPLVAKAEVDGAVQVEVRRDDAATASNVVACLRGSDPQLAEQAVVFSAHMDHVGKRIDGEVFNGADDNASGSAGLLGIAKAFAASKQKPRRSIVFLSVSGEELGLWGSAFFADNPTWPAAAIVANVNTDMIGRNGPESGPDDVMVTPSNRHRMFSTIVQDAARIGERMGIAFTSGDKYYERSDHYNFVKKGIPVVFFCNGEHEDYHQISDHADKLDLAKLEKLTRLAFWTGWNVANADDVPRTIGARSEWK